MKNIKLKKFIVILVCPIMLWAGLFGSYFTCDVSIRAIILIAMCGILSIQYLMGRKLF